MRTITSIPKALEKIGYKLVNDRWSWGAVDRERKSIVLLVWQDQIINREGKRYVEIQRSKEKQIAADDRLGRSERDEHIELLRSGYAGLLVLQMAKDPNASPRTRKEWSDRLSIAGEIIELENGRRMIEITGKVEMRDLQRQME